VVCAEKKGLYGSPVFELEKKYFPEVAGIYGHVPFHDSSFLSMTIDGADCSSIRFEWLFYDFTPEDETKDVYCIASIELAGVCEMRFDTVNYCDFGDGSITEEDGYVLLTLLESATGKYWVFRSKSLRVASCRRVEFKDVPTDDLRIVMSIGAERSEVPRR
jgi:hypothetical protein